MRISLPMKIAALGGLAIASHLATSGIMAQQAARARHDAKSAIGQGASVPVVRRSVTNAPTMVGGHSLKPSSSSHLMDRQFTSDGDQVLARAAASLTNEGRSGIYLWRLKAVRASDGAPQLDMPYVGQAFEMDPSGEMTATFSEQFRLPAGEHRVRLSLHHLPKGFNPADLDDEAKLTGTAVVEINEVVVTY